MPYSLQSIRHRIDEALEWRRFATRLAGFPYHALDTYLPKLVRAGYRVAICDQLEDPKLSKTVVKRGVTELVTPGITDNEKILDHKANNFLCSLHFENLPGSRQGEIIGAAFLDISTGEFYCAQGNSDYIDKMLQSLNPSEIIFSKHHQKYFRHLFGTRFYTYGIDDWVYQFDYTYETLTKHFETHSLKGFGVEEMPHAIIALWCSSSLSAGFRTSQSWHITVSRDWMKKNCVA
jgi:DNA mismatch repair protein MutS